MNIQLLVPVDIGMYVYPVEVITYPFSNTACTFLLPSMVTVTVAFVLVTSPVHLTNFHPDAGVAVSVITVPSLYEGPFVLSDALTVNFPSPSVVTFRV